MITNSDEINIFGDSKTNIFGDKISWENHVNEIINNTLKENIYYNKNQFQEKIYVIKKYKQHGKVLDCGCHIGRWIETFRDNGFEYIGVDQSEYALKIAKENKPDGKFVNILLWNMTFQEEFDIVHFNAVLQHNKLEEQEKILQKVYQSLKSNGILVISEGTVPKQTFTQRTHEGWINFIEKHGFEFKESWNKNELSLEDSYLFVKLKKSSITKDQLKKLLKITDKKDEMQVLVNDVSMFSEIPNTKKLNPKEKVDNIINIRNELPDRHIDMNKWWNSYLAISNKIVYDGVGIDQSNLNDESSSGLVYYINEFSTNIPLTKYPKVLDIGAGNGGETKVLIEKGYSVTGITLGKDNIKFAKEKYNIDLLNMDMNHLNFQINSFDAILTIQTFEHFLSPFIATIEMWRVLKVGGMCYIDVPCPLDKPMWNLSHTNLLYADQIINMFEMCGFKLVKQLSKSKEHRIRLIFEKLSISKIRNWNQLRYIHQLRNEV